MKFRCPVCMYPSLAYPPAHYNICPCCSTEFGNDDSDFSHAQLRQMWLESGAAWFFGQPPAGWNAWKQLISAGFGALVPKPFQVASFGSLATNAVRVATPVVVTSHSQFAVGLAA